MKTGTTSIPKPPSERMIEQALRLIATAAIAPDEEAEQACIALQQWRSRSPRHARAHAEALRRWELLRRMGSELQDHFSEPSARPASPLHSLRMALEQTAITPRRTFLAVAGLGVIGLGWTLGQRSANLQFSRRYATGTTGMEHANLPDGSRLDIDASSAVIVGLLQQRRQAHLEHGRVRFDIAPDARPFTVGLRMGSIQVIGTVFTISDRGDMLQISVSQGQVRWSPDAAAGVLPHSPIDLVAGDRLSVRQDGSAHLEPGAIAFDPAHTDLWRQGWLEFSDEPLAQVLPVLNAYLARPLKSADAHVAQLRLTGRLRSGDPQALLAALPMVLPIRIDDMGEPPFLLLRLR